MIGVVTGEEPRLQLREVRRPTSGQDEAAQEQTARDTGVRPLVYYNGMAVEENWLEYFELDGTGFMPTLRVTFQDPSGTVLNQGFPLDDTVVSVFIRSTTDVLMPIRQDFKVSSFLPVVNADGTRTYHIEGELNVDYMYLHVQRAWRGTSWEVSREIARASGLGFASNIDSTSDSMTWVNHGLPIYDWCCRLTRRSYRSESSFMYSFVDFYNNLNFIDVEEQLSQPTEQSIGKNTMGWYYPGMVKDAKATDAAEMVLTNEPGVSQSETNFTSYRIMFDSTSISLTNGYRKQVFLYDRRGNWDGDKRAGKWWRFELDSITTQGAEGVVILKGSPSNPEFFKAHKTRALAPKLDTDCTHRNYGHVRVQNEQNLSDLEKLRVEIEMPRYNFNLYRFQHIKMSFSNQSSQGVMQGSVIRSLSGDWLIVGIKYAYSSGQARQYVTLVKRELNSSQLALPGNHEQNLNALPTAAGRPASAPVVPQKPNPGAVSLQG